MHDARLKKVPQVDVVALQLRIARSIHILVHQQVSSLSLCRMLAGTFLFKFRLASGDERRRIVCHRFRTRRPTRRLPLRGQ